MEMDLKSMLDYVYIENLNVADSLEYIQSRLGKSAIDEKEMQYWYNFYHRIKQQGRRCRCHGAHAVPRSICSSMLYCCENPFELRSQKLIIGENVPKLICEWNTSYQADFFGAFYTRPERERCCTLDGRYIIQCFINISSVKFIDLFHKKTISLEYKDSKLACLSKTRLSQRSAIKICDFVAIAPRRALLLIRSNDYFENFHRPARANSSRLYASAICLTEINIERATFKFIDACVIEDHNVVLHNNYDRYPSFIGSEFKEDKPLALIVSRASNQAILCFHVSDDQLKIGQVVEIEPNAVEQPIANVVDDNDDVFAHHQIIFMPRIPGPNRHAIMQINLLDEIAHNRRRRRQLNLIMQTCISNKLYGFECKVQQNNAATFYSNHKHVKLLLDRIHVYDLEQQIWDDFQLETPFKDNKLNIWNYHTMVWQWIGNKLFCAVELEPNRTFIIWFDLDLLQWSKMNFYFLDQVYSIVTNYDGDILIETRHKTIYGNRLRRQNQEEEEENGIQEDTRTHCFYRLNMGQPQSLLTMSYLACRDIKEQYPESKTAQILNRITLHESVAPIPKLKNFPSPKPPVRQIRRQPAVNARFQPFPPNRRRAVANIPPLRRSDRLRARRNERQNP